MNKIELKPRKKIMQTIFGFEKGNCFMACVATLFNIELKDVPYSSNIGTSEGWKIYKKDFKNWLYNNYGLYWMCITPDANVLYEYPGLYIVIGKTKRFDGKVNHACIYKNGKLWHDPHPDKTGLTKIVGIDLFIKVMI